jgi:2-polyprenyl-3-methyl-5-hydroxy-6-metoxy-1,4-benzoquinol methylase
MNWDYSRHYARRHPDTPEHDANLRSILLQNLGPHLPPDKDVAVLDVGCGRGYALEWLQSLGYRNLIGIDPDAGQIRFAEARGLRVQRTDDSHSFLDARPGCYDVVLMMDVLEHVPIAAQPALLSAINIALRPGGRLICTVPNAASPLADYWRFVDYTHETLFTNESLEFLLTETGFEAKEILPMEFISRPRLLLWPPSKRTLRWWILTLSRLPTRIAFLGEVGWGEGWRIPLSPNLLATAVRR